MAMKKRNFLLILLVVLLFQTSVSICLAGGLKVKRYPVAGHGRLEIKVPASWNDHVTENDKPDMNLPPVITFRAKGIEMDVSPLWGSKGMVNNSQTKIVKMLERDGGTVLPRTVEKKVDLQEIDGDYCRGYYFSVTSSDPKPGGFRYLTRAGLAVGDLLINVSIQSNDKDSADAREAMASLKTMRQLK
jgi:hypothetical protein